MSEIPFDSRGLSPSSIVTLRKENVSSSLGDEVVILNLKTGVYHGVDGVGAFIWKLLAQPLSLEKICQAVLDEYDVPPDQCRQDVFALVADFAANGLVEIAHASPA